MTTIYRIQDAAGRGPFKPGFTDTWLEDRSDADYKRLKPSFVEFPGILGTMHMLAANYFCGSGCLSLDQLRLWFTPTEYATLRKLGYQAVQLDADRIVAQSDIQCVFARKRAFRKGAKAVQLYAKEPQ